MIIISAKKPPKEKPDGEMTSPRSVERYRGNPDISGYGWDFASQRYMLSISARNPDGSEFRILIDRETMIRLGEQTDRLRTEQGLEW